MLKDLEEGTANKGKLHVHLEKVLSKSLSEKTNEIRCNEIFILNLKTKKVCRTIEACFIQCISQSTIEREYKKIKISPSHPLANYNNYIFFSIFIFFVY